MLIVGQGPYANQLQKLAEKLEVSEYVKFTGGVPSDKVLHYYKAADYFVSASTSETQGLTYTEAMASGLQSIVHGNEYLDDLLDDASLGLRYYDDADFAKTALAYIESGVKIDPEVLGQKLFEISTTNFGDKVWNFYVEIVQNYSQMLYKKHKKPILDWRAAASLPKVLPRAIKSVPKSIKRKQRLKNRF
jgi:1,2-diacylglycerol 3-alpha-glucosyltransferase